jgi:hypothetical protein
MKGMVQSPMTVLTSAYSKPNPHVGAGIIVLAAATLVLSLGVYVFLVVDLIHFRRRMKRMVPWKKVAEADEPGKIADPLFKLRANTRVALAGTAILVKDTGVSGVVREATRGRGRGRGGASTRPTDVPPSPPPSPPSRQIRTVTYRDARKRAQDTLKDKGFKNRSAGGFGCPPEDTAEPSRTERILASPFAWYRPRPADQFQQRAQSVLFRVNGGSCLGMGYRLIVIGANVVIGAIAGCKPLLKAGSVGAQAQCVTVFTLQLLLAWICFCVAPDADRIFSMLGGAQFLAEGLSNLLLFVASLVHHAETKELLQTLAFDAGLVAVFVPILQLVEQRIITPLVSAIQNHGCSPRKIGGAIIVLIAAAPGAIMAAAAALGGGAAGGAAGKGLSVGASVSTTFSKLAVLFGRSAAAGDMAKAAKGKTPPAPKKASSNKKPSPILVKNASPTLMKGQTPGRIIV